MLKFVLFDELRPYHIHTSLQGDIFSASFSPEILSFEILLKYSKWKTL